MKVWSLWEACEDERLRTEVFPEKPGENGVSVRDEVTLFLLLALWHTGSSAR